MSHLVDRPLELVMGESGARNGSVGLLNAGSMRRGVPRCPYRQMHNLLKHMMGRRTKPERVAQLAAEKSKKIQLTNHVTGWNSLTRIWDEHPEHKQILQAMEYDGQLRRLTSLSARSIKRTVRRASVQSRLRNGRKWAYGNQKNVSADSDQKAYALLEFCYGVQAPHNHCSDLIAPGTMVHIGSKTLHLAATNQTTGEHHNTDPVSRTAPNGPRSERSTRPTDLD